MEIIFLLAVVGFVWGIVRTGAAPKKAQQGDVGVPGGGSASAGGLQEQIRRERKERLKNEMNNPVWDISPRNIWDITRDD